MIKVEIENRPVKEQEYITGTKNLVLARINYLIKSLNHLNRNPIPFKPNEISSVKPVTKGIIELVGDNRNINLDGQNYFPNLNTYINNNNNLNRINIAGLLNLLNNLIANNANELDELLKCDPSQLFTLNETLLNTNTINTDINKSVLKFAFNYDIYNEISNPIKSFFRTNNFVKYCPYCNIVEVFHRETPGGQVATTHQLDHFFDKATYPLLSYSMFNLIPSDSICNSTNKSRAQFSDDFHLNPHIGGFGSSMSFVPEVIGTEMDILSIGISINEPIGTRKYRQLIGPNNQVNEDDTLKRGNINAFKLKTKYAGRTKEAKKVIKEVKKTNKGIKSISKFLKSLAITEQKTNYMKWFEDTFGTSFKYSKFNDEAFSKFNRDMHDYYYLNVDLSFSNKFIRELITTNSD